MAPDTAHLWISISSSIKERLDHVWVLLATHTFLPPVMPPLSLENSIENLGTLLAHCIICSACVPWLHYSYQPIPNMAAIINSHYQIWPPSMRKSYFNPPPFKESQRVPVVGLAVPERAPSSIPPVSTPELMACTHRCSFNIWTQINPASIYL